MSAHTLVVRYRIGDKSFTDKVLNCTEATPGERLDGALTTLRAHAEGDITYVSSIEERRT